MCCSDRHDGGTGVLLFLGMVAGAVWWAVKLSAPILLLATVAAWRWFTGAPMWGATAVLAGWPRWQRALARVAVTVPAVAAVWWPWQVAAVVCALGAVTCLAALESRRRAAARLRPIRVSAAVRAPTGAVEGAAPAGAVFVEDLVREVAR